jgi:hypothetical protein
MTAFATYSDLASRLGVTYSPAQQAQVTFLLEDAAAMMRGVMRNQVYPSLSSTYLAYPTGGRVALPQSYIRSVDSVISSLGLPVPFTLKQDMVLVDSDDLITITFTYGLATAPLDLVGINCALVGQVLLTANAGLGLNAGGLSSVSIDDFKAAFADGGAGTGMTLTANTEQYLIDHYGRSAWVVETSR